MLSAHAANNHTQTYETGVAQHHQLYRSGEPEVAVNPANPANLVYVATKFKLHFVPVTGTEVPNFGVQFSEWAWGSGTMGCSLSVSNDYGTTWTEEPFPNSPLPGCADPMAAAAPDGTLYVSFQDYGSPFQDNIPTYPGASLGIARSTDGGRTWTQALPTGVPTDGRPYLRVDQKTGWVWANAGDTFPGCPPAPCGRVLAYSKDKGDTWVQVNNPPTAKTLGTTPPPGPGGVYTSGAPFPGDHFAVNDGILAATIPASSSNPAQFCRLVLSPTDPTTGTYDCTDIPNTTGMTGDSGLGGPFVSADPTTPGRFAVALKPGDNGSFDVFVTENGGDPKPTWTGPTVVQAPNSADTGTQVPFTAALGKPWFDYSPVQNGPAGLLGLMWKGGTSDGKINVYSTISTDNGQTFSKRVQVNTASFSPEPVTDGPGDDLSWMVFGPAGHNGKTNAYVAWGDTRNGKVEGWFGRVPLAAYSG
jgi:hypothetical protein